MMCLICQRIEEIQEGQNPYFVAELSTGYLVLGDHQHFQGYCLFLCKEHVQELDQLEIPFRNQFLSEMADMAQIVKEVFQADKMNIESLGNGDAHLHWHLFPRRSGDLASYGHDGKGPVWWYPMELMYSDEARITQKQLEEWKAALHKALEKTSRN